MSHESAARAAFEREMAGNMDEAARAPAKAPESERMRKAGSKASEAERRWAQYRKRIGLLSAMRQDSQILAGAHAYYASDPIAWIEHWCDTSDPRNAAAGRPVSMPFMLFPRQREMVRFVMQCIRAESNGLIEKSRDIGATWTCCALTCWMLLYMPGVQVGWGSRKEMLVDRIGDPGSIFEKLRSIMRGLPPEMLPEDWDEKRDMGHLKIVNRTLGSSITGEAGDNIGRGGRTLAYFKDESAHYERPELVEAALSENTRTQIDISSVSGIASVFYRKRRQGVLWDGIEGAVPGRTNVFVFDWSDDPRKGPEWHAARKQEMELSGLGHVFAQEVDRDYEATQPRRLVKSEWVRAAEGLHLEYPEMLQGQWTGGADIADEGGDTNAFAMRKGLVLTYLDEWAEGDTGETARRIASSASRIAGHEMCDIMYDSVGVGAGVKAEGRRLEAEGLLPANLLLHPWNAGASVLDPDENLVPGDLETPIAKDFFLNLRAQAWWNARSRLEAAWRLREKGEDIDPMDCLSLSPELGRRMLDSLRDELCQAQAKISATMKVGIDKSPEGVPSPNLADAVIMAFWPAISVEHSYARSLSHFSGGS